MNDNIFGEITPDEARSFINEALIAAKKKPLTDIESIIFQAVWKGGKGLYRKIADSQNFEEGTIKTYASRLWRRISSILPREVKINRNNLRVIAGDYAHSERQKRSSILPLNDSKWAIVASEPGESMQRVISISPASQDSMENTLFYARSEGIQSQGISPGEAWDNLEYQLIERGLQKNCIHTFVVLTKTA